MPDSTGELTAADLEVYTKGRLSQSDPATVNVLAAAVAAARRFCRWHVTGVRTFDVVILDGPKSPLLVLPTQRLTAVDSVVEDGATLDPTTLLWSAAGKIRKVDGTIWSSKYRGLVVTMTHGFDSAPDFARAVLSYADRESLTTMGGRRVVVGPFQYQKEQPSVATPFSLPEEALLRQYRLEGRP